MTPELTDLTSFANHIKNVVITNLRADGHLEKKVDDYEMIVVDPDKMFGADSFFEERENGKTPIMIYAKNTGV